jgi:hypothetical protein
MCLFPKVLAIFASTDVVWPKPVLVLFQLLSIFNFSLNLAPPVCMFSVSYKTLWMFIELFPTFLLAFIVAVWAFTFFMLRYGQLFGVKTAAYRERRNTVSPGLVTTTARRLPFVKRLV